MPHRTLPFLPDLPHLLVQSEFLLPYHQLLSVLPLDLLVLYSPQNLPVLIILLLLPDQKCIPAPLLQALRPLPPL